MILIFRESFYFFWGYFFSRDQKFLKFVENSFVSKRNSLGEEPALEAKVIPFPGNFFCFEQYFTGREKKVRINNRLRDKW